jgi:hypothetical protein
MPETSVSSNMTLLVNTWFDQHFRHDVQLHGQIRVHLLLFLTDVDVLGQGESQWIAQLPSTHKDAFNEAPFLPWTVSDRQAGVVRSAGEGAGNVTYLTVFEAGYESPCPSIPISVLT